MNRFSRRQVLTTGGVLAASLATSLNASAQLSAAPLPARSKFKIIVTGGHPGDPEYGCGGTIARLASMGHDVVLLYLNRGDISEVPGDTRNFPRVAEAIKACSILKARPIFAGQIDSKAILDPRHYDAFREIINAEKPDAVFTHWPIDNHPDHRSMSLLVYDAWRQSKKSFALFYYEVSNGEDTVMFNPTTYVDISTAETLKREACFAHASQNPERYYQLQESIARMRGIESGHKAAESFIHHVQSPPFALPGN